MSTGRTVNRGSKKNWPAGQALVCSKVLCIKACYSPENSCWMQENPIDNFAGQGRAGLGWPIRIRPHPIQTYWGNSVVKCWDHLWHPLVVIMMRVPAALGSTKIATTEISLISDLFFSTDTIALGIWGDWLSLDYIQRHSSALHSLEEIYEKFRHVSQTSWISKISTLRWLTRTHLRRTVSWCRRFLGGGAAVPSLCLGPGVFWCYACWLPVFATATFE